MKPAAAVHKLAADTELMTAEKWEHMGNFAEAGCPS